MSLTTLQDVRVVVEGISGLLAVSSGRSIHILDPCLVK